MGIRVNKVMGWGVKLNVRTWEHQYDEDDPSKTYTKHEVEDPRIDIDAITNGRDGDGGEGDFYERDTRALLQWLEEHENAVSGLTHGEGLLKKEVMGWQDDDKWKPESMYDLVIHHGSDGGVPGVLLFIPPGYSKRWHRRDDTMDWMEETYPDGKVVHDTQRDHFQFFENIGGIYPWQGWVRFRGDSKRFQPEDDHKSELAKGRMTPHAYSMLIGTWSKRGKPLAGEALVEHLKNDWRPVIPDGIKALVFWLHHCHPDAFGMSPEDFLNQLRPMRYTFWR